LALKMEAACPSEMSATYLTAAQCNSPRTLNSTVLRCGTCTRLLYRQFSVYRNTKKKYQVMRFTSSVNVDFSKWTQVKMERENNMKEFRGTEEETPKSVLSAR
jgi:hypothetical protein